MCRRITQRDRTLPCQLYGRACRHVLGHTVESLRDEIIRAPEKLLDEAARIFREENVAYGVDPRGGVHYLVDAEFEANRQATIAALSGPRYDNVRDVVERAQAAFSEIPPDGKGAIRNTFAAAEGLFKLLLPSQNKLNGAGARKHLTALVESAYQGDDAAAAAAAETVASFSEWADAAQHYRHEQGSEKIIQPPLELAVNLVSLGNSFARWLAELDATSSADPVRGRA
jgi:preprotein translocase subunit SecD